MAAYAARMRDASDAPRRPRDPRPRRLAGVAVDALADDLAVRDSPRVDVMGLSFPYANASASKERGARAQREVHA
ncbi:hypothetical protein, partial [uncultured Corynebacterium sp.]|uniref:hypothetical protein n=1 Tax=uncultured Corynebacterium sp. TaxID=159447 RepID=UPI00260837C5